MSGWLRDALWQEVQVTECPSQCPERSVCGLLVHILKDPGVSKEMHSLVEATMQWMLRDDHPEDKECLSVQEEDTHVNSAAQNQANQALSSLSSNLDKFLDMYGSENESETEVNENEVVSLVEEFECALCRQGVSKDPDMFPCLLCHFDTNAASGGYHTRD